MQLDIEKVYDNVSWSFIAQLMSHMGFGERMSQLSLMLRLGATSHVMLISGVIKVILLTRSLRERCPLSSLFICRYCITNPS